MTGPSSSSPATKPWWRHIVDNRKKIAGVTTAILVVVCPLLPPQAQVPCRLAQTGLNVLGKIALDDDASSSSSSSAPSSPASCSGNETRSLPHFCRCVDGTWRDYFDVDAGCPED